MPAKPIIFTVDDEEQVCDAVERDLVRHYRQNYRIIRNDTIALFLVDQRMPNMSGTEFLAKALKVYQEARKVLLTAYADTEAAISAINTVGLDHYLMKPWTPAEENLYPVLDDLISDWEATATLPYDGIRVAGTLWSASSHSIKDFLARSQIPYQFLDIERDVDAKSLVEQANESTHRLPVVFFPEGDVLIEPSLTEVAEKAGLQTQADEPFYDLIVVGAGPAGLAAAVYGASEGVHTLLIDKETPGGQAGTSSRIENYLGFPKGLSGADLARRATAQAGSGQRRRAGFLSGGDAGQWIRTRVPRGDHRNRGVCAGTRRTWRQSRDGRRRLLRRRDNRGGQLQRRTCLRGRWRKLGGSGGDLPVTVR
jgi:thioredoxin reductase (NADPH)